MSRSQPDVREVLVRIPADVTFFSSLKRPAHPAPGVMILVGSSLEAERPEREEDRPVTTVRIKTAITSLPLLHFSINILYSSGVNTMDVSHLPVSTATMPELKFCGLHGDFPVSI